MEDYIKMVARESKADLADQTIELRRQIVRTALVFGRLDIWKEVFDDDYEITQMLIDGFEKQNYERPNPL